MKILVVGGTGMIGGCVALHLQSLDHSVTVSSRSAPAAAGTPIGELEWIACDYLDESYDTSVLSAFEAIVFCAGQDIRHVPSYDDLDEYFLQANAKMVPRFAALAKAAGVKSFINIGSFYPQAFPESIETNAYVRSRHLADKGVTSLSDDAFKAISINAPFVVGLPPSTNSPMFNAYFSYARGQMPHLPVFGPAGGTNFISTQSLSEAVGNALLRGVGGRSYLVGDENLSFAEFFKMFLAAVDNDVAVPALDYEHPLLPDPAIVQGRGNVIAYEPDQDDASLLGYTRNDVARSIRQMAADLDGHLGPVSEVVLGSDATSHAELLHVAKTYARCMDANDVELLRTIMTDDIVLHGPGFLMEGWSEVSGVPAQLAMTFLSTQHIVHDQWSEIDGDQALAETRCTASHVCPPVAGNSDPVVLVWAIRYQDTLVRQDAQWRFKRRGIIVDWVELRPAITS